jgi:hypothetical protein
MSVIRKAQFCETHFEMLIIMKLYPINYTFIVMSLYYACRIKRLGMLWIVSMLVL